MTIGAETPGDPTFVAQIFAVLRSENVDLPALASSADKFLILAEGCTDIFLLAMQSVARAAFEYGMMPTPENHENLQVASRAASMVSALYRH